MNICNEALVSAAMPTPQHHLPTSSKCTLRDSHFLKPDRLMTVLSERMARVKVVCSLQLLPRRPWHHRGLRRDRPGVVQQREAVAPGD